MKLCKGGTGGVDRRRSHRSTFENVPEFLSSEELWRWNHSRCLIRIAALYVARIDRSRDVVVGRSIGDGRIGVKRACVQDRIDFGIRSARLHATINVVTDDVRRGARGPGEIDAMLRGRGSSAGEIFDGRRIRGIAGERYAAGCRASSGRRKRYGELHVLPGRNRNRERQSGYSKS